MAAEYNAEEWTFSGHPNHRGLSHFGGDRPQDHASEYAGDPSMLAPKHQIVNMQGTFYHQQQHYADQDYYSMQDEEEDEDLVEGDLGPEGGEQMF